MAAGVRGVNPFLQPYRFVFFSPDAGSVAMFGYGLRMWAVFVLWLTLLCGKA
jgi:hypothetical protein